MRSSNKSRSRNKNSSNINRRGTSGNIVNRVFDSAGPEGKVRGTPQQIIEKYQSLSHDALMAGDRIGSENFAQHAEHYTRLLGAAQREMAERRDSMDVQRKDNEPQESEVQVKQPAQQKPKRHDARKSSDGQDQQPDISSLSSDELFPGGDDDSTLVQTPENTEKKPAKKPAPRKRKPAQEPAPAESQPVSTEETIIN